jgi:hypothetical protein
MLQWRFYSETDLLGRHVWKLSNQAKSMQDPLTQNDKVNALLENLKLWKVNIERNILPRFLWKMSSQQWNRSY